jgi:hypothetical protein
MREGIDLGGKDRELWNVLAEMLCAMKSMESAENSIHEFIFRTIDYSNDKALISRFYECATDAGKLAAEKFSEYFTVAVGKHALCDQIKALRIKPDKLFFKESCWQFRMAHHIQQKIFSAAVDVPLAHSPLLTLLREWCHSTTISSVFFAFCLGGCTYISGYNDIICMGSNCHVLFSAIADIAIECAELALDYVGSDDFIPDSDGIQLRDGQTWTKFLREEFGELGRVQMEHCGSTVHDACEKLFGDHEAAVKAFNRSMAEVREEMVEKQRKIDAAT